MLISTIFNGFTGLITSYFQATGKAKQAIIMSISQGTLFIPTIIVANSVLGLHGVIFSMPIAEFLTFLLGILLFFYKRNVPDVESEAISLSNLSG
jgi:Na+-driven multidrug efflux pump